MSIIISDGKEHAENTGLSENHPKKTQKMHFLSKIAKEKELK